MATGEQVVLGEGCNETLVSGRGRFVLEKRCRNESGGGYNKSDGCVEAAKKNVADSSGVGLHKAGKLQEARLNVTVKATAGVRVRRGATLLR